MSTLTFSDFPQLERHYELLCRWNKVLNLTRIEQRDEAIERHYGESLFLAEHLTPGTVADVGSGAGFPGFVVAVARPDCQVTLIESHQRKGVFLREASRDIPNLRILTKRAEDVHEHFDWLVSRAVSYSDLSKVVGMADKIALLSGAEEPPGSWNRTWETIIIPNARNRFLRVSRETGKISCFT
jgi:16S rRNA (guanine527-N7)-methyltransferase